MLSDFRIGMAVSPRAARRGFLRSACLAEQMRLGMSSTRPCESDYSQILQSKTFLIQVKSSLLSGVFFSAKSRPTRGIMNSAHKLNESGDNRVLANSRCHGTSKCRWLRVHPRAKGPQCNCVSGCVWGRGRHRMCYCLRRRSWRVWVVEYLSHNNYVTQKGGGTSGPLCAVYDSSEHLQSMPTP